MGREKCEKGRSRLAERPLCGVRRVGTYGRLQLDGQLLAFGPAREQAEVEAAEAGHLWAAPNARTALRFASMKVR